MDFDGFGEQEEREPFDFTEDLPVREPFDMEEYLDEYVYNQEPFDMEQYLDEYVYNQDGTSHTEYPAYDRTPAGTVEPSGFLDGNLPLTLAVVLLAGVIAFRKRTGSSSTES